MLNPIQEAVLRELLSDPAVIAAKVTGESLDTLATAVAAAESLSEASQLLLGDMSFTLQLDFERKGTATLTAPTILSECRKGRTHFVVDKELRLITRSSDSARLIDVQTRSVGTQIVELVCHGSYVYWLIGGRIVRERSLTSATSLPPLVTSWRRPMVEFDDVLQDQVREMVRGERGVRYWFDKTERILLAGPDGTERIFHGALFWWLDHFVADKIRVYAEPHGFGQDTTDIVAVTFSGDYVIEVKWLGTNETGTKYSRPRIDEGLRQVKIYLDNDPRFVAGYAVFYDGRSADKHHNDSDFDPTARHANCAPPKLLFLESEAPSKAARQARSRKL